jgi:hypothetical protein
MSRRKTKALLDRADRLHATSLPPVALLYGSPEPSRLGFDLASERMALIKGELFEATEEETTRAFHHRLCAIARARKVMLIEVGSDEPMKECRYNRDGTLKVPPPEDEPTLN